VAFGLRPTERTCRQFARVKTMIVTSIRVIRLILRVLKVTTVIWVISETRDTCDIKLMPEASG
jgi:hypothetical protein